MKQSCVHESPGIRILWTILIILIFSIASGVAAQETNDTIARELQEISVLADMQSVNATSSTFYPTKYAKQSARNGYDLLNMMNIPTISVTIDSSEITTPTGQPVTVFINYVESSTEEMSGLRGQDVKRVEYLDFPSDTRFQGAQHVINIIMRNYEYGGYTKLTDAYYALDALCNRFSAFSKFAYKSMTYDLYAGFENHVLKREGITEKSLFSLASGDMEKIRDYKDSRQTGFSVPVTFRALWQSDKATISNTVGFTFYDALKQYESGGIRFSPAERYIANDYEYDTPTISRSVSWNGNYYFSFPNKWSLSVDPNMIYTHYNATNQYILSLDGNPKDIIVNDSREDAWNLKLSATLRKIMGDHYLNIMFSGANNGNDISYYGTTPSSVDFRMTTLISQLFYTFNSGNKFSLNADMGLIREWFRTNGERYNDLYPFAHVSVAYSPNSKNRVTGWFQLATNSPNVFMRSPNVIQQEEMLYQTGNPLIKNARHYTLYLTYSYFPSNVIQMMFATQYYWSGNTPVRYFSEYDDGKALLMSYQNMGDYRSLAVFGNFTLRLLDGRLNINAAPEYDYFRTSGYSYNTLNRFLCKLNAQYYFGNFNITANYTSLIHRLEEFSESRRRYPASYWVQCGWSKGSWNLSLYMFNFLRYNYKGVRTDYVSQLYSSNAVNFSFAYHAYGLLTATYTFGYGKKTTDRSEIGEQGGVSSSKM